MWKAKFGKMNSNSEEDLLRFKIFSDNFDFI